VNPPASAKDAYPISGLTFLLIPKQGKNPAETQLLKDFVRYMITQGQQQAENLGYAKLPSTLEREDEGLLAQVGTGKPANQASIGQ
jgi:phosphate transport system substrate-binding protein